jgi:hypothetical protein
MSFGKAYFLGATSLCLAFACGGSSFSSGEGGDAGSPSAGSTSKSGSSSTAGQGGASSSGGSKGMGLAGTVAFAGSVGTGGMSCGLVLCASPECPDGEMPVTPPGECCPSCPTPQIGCEGVMCEPVMSCGAGYEHGRPAGACCDGCVPVQGMVACPEIACPPENHCPLGYVPGDRLGGCCTDCVPDPLFCNSKDDCIIADRPRPCCGCPEPISMRQYAADACWSAPSMPRMTPPECQPQFVCDAICSPCPPPGPVACVEHRCTELPAP